MPTYIKASSDLMMNIILINKQNYPYYNQTSIS
jgi:hypothetical protein